MNRNGQPRPPLTERIGSTITTRHPDSYTHRELRRRGTAFVALVLATAGVAVVAKNFSTDPNNFDHADCVAGLLDDTPTFQEAKEITAEFCSTGDFDQDERVANQAVDIKLDELFAD